MDYLPGNEVFIYLLEIITLIMVNRYAIINAIESTGTSFVFSIPLDWIERIWCFKSLSTLFRSYQDDGRRVMKGSVQ